ncbi:MAG: SHOCT domain-containing protein [Alphaproteobacteria bacterium]
MSIADEIAKLQNLRSEGVITEAEFEQQKKVLIGGGDKPSSASNVPAWDQIPIHKKWWFQALLTLVVVPVGVIFILFVPSYRKKKSQVIPTERWFKLAFVIIAIIAWGMNLDKIVGGSTTASVPACDSGRAKGVVKDAVERNAAGASLRLLELKDTKELFFDSVKPERLCAGIAVLNSGDEAIRYRLWLTADKKMILGEVRSAN